MNAVTKVVQNVSLDAFKRDKQLKAIRSAFSKTERQRQLVEDLHEFFIENDLYRDILTTDSPLNSIQEEDLKLVAFEIFGE